MTTTDTRSIKDLFRSWRSGDAASGQLMAQRFADWYYAVATSRLGESAGREPCERACARFQEGVVKQTDARALIKWAHEIVLEETKARGSRIADGNESSTYTGNQKPKELLVKARAAMKPEVDLLVAVYTGQEAGKIDALAEPFGGMPIAVLKARYRIKSWLKDNANVPFEVTPDEPVKDRAPLPLYESGRMATAAEEDGFEQWMLTDLDLCKDIAEFAQFAIALRGGLPAEAATKARTMSEGDDTSGMSSTGKAAIAGGGLALVLGGGVVVVLLILAIILGVMFLT